MSSSESDSGSSSSGSAESSSRSASSSSSAASSSASASGSEASAHSASASASASSSSSSAPSPEPAPEPKKVSKKASKKDAAVDADEKVKGKKQKPQAAAAEKETAKEEEKPKSKPKSKGKSKKAAAAAAAEGSDSDDSSSFSGSEDSLEKARAARQKARKARKAAKAGDAEASRAAHDAAAGRAPEQHKEEGKYIKSIVYGGLDGIITTFAVVASVAGADLPLGIVVVMGFANLFADGMSMGMGDFLSSRAEIQFMKEERRRENYECENYLEGEQEEMVDLYVEKGLSREDAQTVVDIISKDQKVFVDIMMVEELGINPEDEDEEPWKNGLVTFFSFLACGLVPLLSYIVVLAVAGSATGSAGGAGGAGLTGYTFWIAAALTALTMFALGALTSRFTSQSWWYAGFLMLFNGSLTAIVAFLIGLAMAAIVGDTGCSAHGGGNSTSS